MRVPRLRGNFMDTLRLYLQAGAGGAGHPKYGGLGGPGGNIYIQASKSESGYTGREQNPVSKVITF